MITAERLFRRFQRTVETIDKKDNFPAPSIRQRKSPATDPKSPTDVAESSGAEANLAGKAVAKPTEAEIERIITPELRNLLSRKVEVLKKEEVVKHGGGV